MGRNNWIKEPKPQFETAVFADLTKEQLDVLVHKYTTGYYPSIVLNIEPMNIIDKKTRTYITTYTVLVIASKTPATIADIVAEFKKLLPYHKPKM